MRREAGWVFGFLGGVGRIGDERILGVLRDFLALALENWSSIGSGIGPNYFVHASTTLSAALWATRQLVDNKNSEVTRQIVSLVTGILEIKPDIELSSQRGQKFRMSVALMKEDGTSDLLDLRSALVETLGEIGGPGEIEVVRKCLQQKSTASAEGAVKALAKLVRDH